MTDYSISWGYIVARMKSLYGISPYNEDKVAFGDIENRMNYIWQEYCDGKSIPNYCMPKKSRWRSK